MEYGEISGNYLGRISYLIDLTTSSAFSCNDIFVIPHLAILAIVNSKETGLGRMHDPDYTHLILSTHRWMVLEGKYGIFHVYEENLPCIFIPLWLTTVEGAKITSVGSALTRSSSTPSDPWDTWWGSYATHLTVWNLPAHALSGCEETFSLYCVHSFTQSPPPFSHVSAVMKLATHFWARWLPGPIFGHLLWLARPSFMIHSP